MGQQERPNSDRFVLLPPIPRFKNPLPFTAAALTRDRVRLVGLDADGLLVGWNARTARRLFRVRGIDPKEPPHRLTCSPDGRFVAVSRRDHVPSLVRVFRLDTGEEVRRLDRCFSPCFSPDGEILAGTDGPRLRRWALKSGAELPGLGDADEDLKWAAYSPSGKRIAASCASSVLVHVWTLESRTKSIYSAPDRALVTATSLAFSPDEKTLAVGHLWGLRTLNLTEEAQPHVLACEEYSNGPLKFSADGRRMIAVCQRRRLLIWDVATGQDGYEFTAPVTSEGILDVSDGGDAILWFDREGLRVERIPEFLGDPLRGHPIVAASFTSEGQVITGDAKGVIRLWDPATQKEIPRPQGPAQPVKFFAREGRWAILWGGGDPIRIWDVQGGRELLRVPAEPLLVNTIVVSPDGGKLALGSLDGSLSLWTIAEKRELARITLDLAGIEAICWSRDGKSMAWGDLKGSIVIADGRTGGDRTEFKPRSPGAIRELEFSRDGRVLIAQDHEGNCRSYDGALGREPALVDRDELQLLRSFPPDRRWAASGLRQFWHGPVTYSPDGAYALTMGYGSVQIWNAPGEK